MSWQKQPIHLHDNFASFGPENGHKKYPSRCPSICPKSFLTLFTLCLKSSCLSVIVIYLPVQQYSGLNILSVFQPLFTFDGISNKITKKNIFIGSGKVGVCQKIHNVLLCGKSNETNQFKFIIDNELKAWSDEF